MFVQVKMWPEGGGWAWRAVVPPGSTSLCGAGGSELLGATAQPVPAATIAIHTASRFIFLSVTDLMQETNATASPLKGSALYGSECHKFTVKNSY